MKQYIKKPIPVSALQWTGKNIDKIKEFCTDSEGNVKCFTSGESLWIETREGQLKSEVRDYIMRGIEGEFYPCGEQIFLKTYDEFNESEFHEFAHKEIPITSLHNATSHEPNPIILDEIIKDNNSTISDELFDVTKIIGNGIKKEKLNPYLIRIKNLTDEKLYDVDLFNYKHDKQNKIEYSCGMGVDYDKFLRILASNRLSEEKIDLFKITVCCDYPKFRNKQINCCLHTIYEEPNGNFSSFPTAIGIYFSAYQQQADIVDVQVDTLKIQLNNLLQLRLSYLMPETEIVISIFPYKIID